MLSSLLATARVVPEGVTSWDWIHAGIIFLVSVVVAALARRMIGRAFAGDSERVVVRLASRFFAYLVVCAGLVYALAAVRVQIGPLIGALGIGGIALAFALQDTLQNLVAGVIIQTRRPIRRGDTVEVGGYQGVVRDIDLRNVSVRTFDGLDVYVPNKSALESAIVNYTISPTRRLTLEVGVGYQTDLEAAQQVILQAVSGVGGVLAAPAPTAWVADFGDSSIEFSVMFWFEVATSNMWKVRSDVAMAVKRALDGSGVELPFPQRTLSLNADLARLLDPDHQPAAGPQVVDLLPPVEVAQDPQPEPEPGRPEHHHWTGVFHH